MMLLLINQIGTFIKKQVFLNGLFKETLKALMEQRQMLQQTQAQQLLLQEVMLQ